MTECCRVPFSIGRWYKDEVVCDVLEMDACHILLGRPWQYDVNATHHGKDNVYEFLWQSKMIKFLPMAASNVAETQSKIGQLFTVNGPEFNHHLKETQLVIALLVQEKVIVNKVVSPVVLR